MKAFGEEVLDEYSIRKLEIGQCVTLRSLQKKFGKMSGGRGDVKQEIKTCGHRLDNGELRGTHHTFRRVSRFVWYYCGKCFFGETVERGQDLIPKKKEAPKPDSEE